MSVNLAESKEEEEQAMTAEKSKRAPGLSPRGSIQCSPGLSGEA